MDKYFKKDLRLANRIIRFLKGTLSSEREKSFREEMDKDEALRTFIEKITEESFFDQKIKSYTKINVHEKWQKHLAARPSARDVSLHKVLPRVAAILLPLFIVASLYYWYSSRSSGDISDPTFSQSHILPGGNKAILTLDDGSSIVLDNAQNGNLAQQGNTKIIKLNSGQLLYNDSTSKLAEYIDSNSSAPPSQLKMQINTLSTPRGGQYHLTLSDGTKVWLNAASGITFPTAFYGNKRIVEIRGEAYFEVAKNANQPFIVKINNKAEIKVLGTHFNVNAYKDETTIKTTLLEGSVQVSSLITPNSEENHLAHSVLISPGQQAIIDQVGRIEVNKVNTTLYTAWKDGRLAFKDEALENIINCMARWYDFEAVYADPSVKDLSFTGNIERKASVEEVLRLLEKTERIKFEINHKTIRIMKEP